MRCIQLTHHFLKAGYLLRGGVSIGNVCHTQTNIVGTAYQKAYNLEKNGNHPCILLSDEAKNYWDENHNGSRMCIQIGEDFIVNGLHDFYIPGNTEHGNIEDTRI